MATDDPRVIAPHKFPYALIVFKGTDGKPERLGYDQPWDALIAAISYLRNGYQCRLSDPTCEALGVSGGPPGNGANPMAVVFRAAE